jgi:TP901 family phage tail tape measure protein
MNFISSITLQFRDAFSAGFSSASNSFAGMKGALDDINQNQSMNRLAADLAMASSLTDPFRQKLSALMDEPSRLAGTFESSMKNIQAITGSSAAEIDKLGETLLGIGSQSAAGTLAVADAFNDVAGGIALVSEGVPLLDVQLQVLNNSLALAEAGQADLGTAAEGLTKIMNAYSFTMGSVEEVNEKAAWASDVMTQAVGMGMGSMQEFISSMAPISGMASSVGVGFDEIGSTMAYMTATTDSAATAGTKLQAFMIALQKPSDDLAKALTSMGYESGSAMLAQEGLAESANIVSRAFGGNQDAMIQAMGRAEAMKAVISLTGDAYTDFATQFGEGMKGVTASAQAIQVESYESKVGRLNAATDALKIQIGGDINNIKGFFVDMGAGFLTNVVGPIMSSPVGEVFQGIAAGVGFAAKGILDLGSGALNTATQLVVMTSTIQNAGGFSKLFGSVLGGIASPLKQLGTSIAGMIGPLIAKTTATFAATAAEVGFAGAMWATAGAIWAATWPILAIVAGVAALAVGGYMLVKHWDAVSAFFVNLWNKITGAFSAAFDWIKNLLGGVPNWVLGALAVFMPFIGIPALIIKNWDSIKAFFAELWDSITAAFSAAWTGITNFFVSLWENVSAFFVGLWVRAKGLFISIWEGIPGFFASLWNNIVGIVTVVANWFTSVWTNIVSAFTIAWNAVLSFFNYVWNAIVQTVMTVANWFSGVWGTVTGAFAAAWTWVSDLFTSIWEGIKGVVMGFVEWLSPVIDMIIAPFKAIGNVIGGIIGTVKGWFGETVEMGRTEIAGMSENRTQNSVAKPADTLPAAPIVPTAVAAPSFAAQVVPAPATAGTVPPLTTTSAVAAPPALDVSAAVAAPTLAATSVTSVPAIGTGTSTGTSGGSALLAEHLAAAERKGIAASEITSTASDAFMSAGASVSPAAVTPSVDMAELNRQAASNPFLDSFSASGAADITPGMDMANFDREVPATFQEAMPQQNTAFAPWSQSEAKPAKKERPSFNVQNLYLQSDDMKNMYDLYLQLEMVFGNQEEAMA